MRLRIQVFIAMLLVTGCGREPRATPRSDSATLAASGGVRTDSGAVPMRVGGDQRRQADARWSEVSPPVPEDAADAAVIVEVDDDADDVRHEVEMRVDEARHEAEMRAEEAAAAVAAAAEAQAALAAAEAEAAVLRVQRRELRRAGRHHHSHTMRNRP